MSRRSYIALTLLLSVAMTACQDDKKSIEPASAPVFARSADGDVRISDEKQLAELRKVTARFHEFDEAKNAGYSTAITPCWAHHSAGAMGYHYGNTSLLDASVSLLQPEVLIYEPLAGKKMKLVGMEYIVPLAAWEAAGHDLANPTDVPQLLEQKFTRHSSLPIFKLHIWLWQENPSGTYADWNPKVSCKYADSTEVF